MSPVPVDTYETNKEIQIFRDYLRIPTAHPNIDYEPCLAFLRKQAESLKLEHRIVIVKDPKKPLLVVTWKGENPDLPAILLNSHMDVVPAYEEHWTYPPFAAEMHNGRIYARGAQDIKCVGTQYLGAIRALQKTGFKPQRTFHLTYVPEEEVGGVDGMRDFVHTDDFKALNIGFALDEAGPSTDDQFHLVYAERAIWTIEFKINGPPGHGLQLFEGTVGEKATYLMNKLQTFRETQIKMIDGRPPFMPTVTAINLTKVQGGVQPNVIPAQLVLTYDMRLAINVSHSEWETQLRQWCVEAGGGIEINFLCKDPDATPTKLNDSNPYWLAFEEAIDELDIEVMPAICPGATDIRYVRALGIPALGFSPMNNTPFLLHDHDECLDAEIYLRGIEIYQCIIEKLSEDF